MIVIFYFNFGRTTANFTLELCYNLVHFHNMYRGGTFKPGIGLVENAGTRICGYADMRVCGYADMRVWGYADMRVCGYAGMRVCEYAGTSNWFNKQISKTH